jgi:hypothetical protein
MTPHDVLDREIVWDEEGHLSEVAKSALADGQDAILPPDALTHFSRCHACVEGVGRAALLSAQFSAALGAAPRVERSLPWIPIGAALVVAAVSAIPMFAVARLWLSASSVFFARGVRIAGHGLLTLAANGLAPTFYFASTFVLLAMGFAIARLVPRTAVQ